MSDNDLIRRGDALDAMCKGPRTVQERIDALRALPAVQVTVKPCGGCGERNPQKRCIGCFHDFGTPDSALVPALLAERDDLRAKLVEVVDALEECQQALHDHMMQYPHMAKGYTVDAEKRARTTLTKIKGADHE